MELLFIRHGQGEHNLNTPKSWEMEHPQLSELGRKQVKQLFSSIRIAEDDLFVISPTRRTIETSTILVANLNSPKIYITPLIGPRMFPQRKDWAVLPCDQIYDLEILQLEFRHYQLMEPDDSALWKEGINRMEDRVFHELGYQFITWCKHQRSKRVLLITHDGTINCYRELLGEKNLTRSDFLGEAGVYKINMT